jgi:D-arabinose 1-dehydrogenase-like Zn-dependent alcohol dehydrogenase
MRAVVFSDFGGTPEVREIDAPTANPQGAVIRVEATGVCRSDWHAWMGHDPDVRLPHVPGHEFAGVVEAVGSDVRKWRPGDRVTVPFVCACGSCGACLNGQHQVCENQTQPGFTHEGSFAEYVRIEHADVNLVRLPDSVDFVSAAALGCRFATAFRAVREHGHVHRDQWVAVHGCGGVGLSAVMIATELGARVVAIDVSSEALALALELGAAATIDATAVRDIGTAVIEITGGGAHVSIDAFGSQETLASSIESLRRRGRHVQVGLLPEALGRPTVPMARVVWLELTLHGSHGMAAHDYTPMLDLVASGTLKPGLLVTDVITLDEAPDALTAMSGASPVGTRVIRPHA